MKKLWSIILLHLILLAPAVVLAHGGVDDGDSPWPYIEFGAMLLILIALASIWRKKK